jgi:hypothetical protein
MSTKFVQIKGLGSKISPPQGVINFPLMYIEITYKICFRQSESTIDYIFGMKHLLVDVYQDCPNKSLRVKIGPAPWGYCYSLYVYSKT